MPKYNPQTMRHYKGNPNLKCAGVQMQYSADQIAERIKCTQDPEYFIETYLKIIHVDKGLVPFKLYDFQKTLLKAYTDNRFVIAKLPRQVGKSTVTVAYILHTVLFGPMQNIAILANKASTARDILGKLQLAYEHIPLWMQQGITSWNRGSIEIENGSKVVAASTAKSSIRGNTYNCVSGNSTTKIKIDGEEIEISFAQLYEIIANSSKYKCNKFNDEIQYVHRQQIQENLFPNNTSGHGANNANYWDSGETPYYTKMYGRKRCGQQFSIFNHKGAHISPSAIAQNGIDNESQEIAFICSLSDDIRKTRPTATVRYSKTESIASAIESGPENSSHWEKTHRGDKEKNWFGAFRENSFGRTKIQTINSNDRETIRHQEARGIFTKNICGTDWEKEDNRTRQQDKQESRKNKEDGRGSSWNEAERRVKNENEPGCQRTNSLEQRKSRNIFSRSSEKNEGCKSWYSFNRRTQNEFEKIQILTEKGYKNFHGIKKTAQQNTIKLTIECGEIVCTPDHKLFSDIGYVEAKNCLGISVLNHNGLFYKITDIQQNHKIDVYDLLEVEDTHSYYCNNFLVHQCIFLDEFAFVPTNIAEEFITSVYPTISSGATTKLFMVSTPNGMNLFYKYWTDAINKRNLYVPIEAHWSVVPGRDAQWAADQIKQLGQEKFNQEFNCVAGDTVIETSNGKETIEDVFNQSANIYLIYKITRDDGKQYIGTTIKRRIKQRMCSHKHSSRFVGHEFTYEVLEESTSKEYIAMKEEYYIQMFNTFVDGLNESESGKGNHHAPNFTTLGYKYSEHSRRKMSESAKLRMSRLGPPNKGKFHTQECKDLFSKMRKGKIHSYKLSDQEYLKIRNEFSSTKTFLEIKKSKNGKILTAERQFAKTCAGKYNTTPNNIMKILLRKTLR